MTKQTDALKPCPFCGCQPKYDEVFLDDCELYQVACSNERCGMTGLFISSHYKDEVVKVWNTRADPLDANARTTEGGNGMTTKEEAQKALEVLNKRYSSLTYHDYSLIHDVLSSHIAQIEAPVEVCPIKTRYALERVSEFIRQREQMRGINDIIYAVHSDVNARQANLTVTDLKILIRAATARQDDVAAKLAEALRDCMSLADERARGYEASLIAAEKALAEYEAAKVTKC